MQDMKRVSRVKGPASRGVNLGVSPGVPTGVLVRAEKGAENGA